KVPLEVLDRGVERPRGDAPQERDEHGRRLAAAAGEPEAAGATGLFVETPLFDQGVEVFPRRLGGAEAEGVHHVPHRRGGSLRQTIADESKDFFSRLARRGASHGVLRAFEPCTLNIPYICMVERGNITHVPSKPTYAIFSSS